MMVVIVDDERGFVGDVETLVKALGYETRTYYTVADARQGLMELEDLFVLLLDHDFGLNQGKSEAGYELCAYLRTAHPFGMLLPVVYLTGRETEGGFLQQLQAKCGLGPSMFVTKTMLATNSRLLPELLSRISEDLDGIREAAEFQAAKRALLVLKGAPVEDPDEA